MITFIRDIDWISGKTGGFIRRPDKFGFLTATTATCFSLLHLVHKFRLLLLVSLALAIVSSACNNEDSAKIAEIDGHAVKLSDLDKYGGKELSDQRQRLYALERRKLEELIGARLLTREAQSKGISVSTLLDQEVSRKAQEVKEEEILAFYNDHKERIRIDYDKVHDQIRDYLREQRLEKQKNEFLESLRAKAKVITYLKPPPVYRAEVNFSGAPVRGAEKAPVTIVKFEDFQCPFCKTVQPTFKDLLKKYDGKVRVFHKDLPLEAIHPQARQAAEAARCAGEQGKFWEYHDLLYANSTKLGLDDLKGYAGQLGLNVESFRACYNSGKYRAAVQKDLNEGAQLGLTGTPTFFINGREISGAQPLEKFSEIIDEELARAR